MEAFGLQEVRERTMVVAGGLEEDAGWRLEAMKVICEEAELGPALLGRIKWLRSSLDYRTPKEFKLPNQTINTIENLQL
jgi:hypothetical protein